MVVLTLSAKVGENNVIKEDIMKRCSVRQLELTFSCCVVKRKYLSLWVNVHSFVNEPVSRYQAVGSIGLQQKEIVCWVVVPCSLSIVF